LGPKKWKDELGIDRSNHNSSSEMVIPRAFLFLFLPSNPNGANDTRQGETLEFLWKFYFLNFPIWDDGVQVKLCLREWSPTFFAL
jgi:hypothetical protein